MRCADAGPAHGLKELGDYVGRWTESTMTLMPTAADVIIISHFRRTVRHSWGPDDCFKDRSLMVQW